MRTVVLGLAAGSSVALAAALGAGCGGTGGDNLFGSGVGGATTTSSVTGSGTPVTGTSTTGTSDTSVTATTTSGSGPSTTSTTTTTSSGPTTTSTGSGGGKCDPAAGDSACTTCTKASCCNDVVACSNDSNCTCWVGCLQQHPNNYQVCFGQCGNPDGNTTALAKCTTNGGPCSQACGGGGSTTTTTTGGGNACSPQATDSACASCTKMKCCSSVTACATDTNCQCWTQCLGNGGGASLCQQICGGFDGTTTQLFQCSGSQCQGICQ